MDRPVLFCYDGSEGSKAALSVAVELVMHPADAVVLVVWTPVALQLARGGSLLVAVPNEGEIDEEEIAAAQRIADEGAEGARTYGYNASARVAEANESVVKTISEVAREIDAGLIVCGQRGRGALASAVLGSVSPSCMDHSSSPSRQKYSKPSQIVLGSATKAGLQLLNSCNRPIFTSGSCTYIQLSGGMPLAAASRALLPGTDILRSKSPTVMKSR